MSRPWPTDERILGLIRDHPDVGFTAQDIAEIVGTTPHVVHESVSWLRRAGLLQIQCVRVYKTPGFRSGVEVVAERESL